MVPRQVGYTGRLLALWLALLLGLLARPAAAQPFTPPGGAYLDPASQFVLPESLGGMVRTSAFDYEQRFPGLGVSFKYQTHNPEVFADIYIFNNNRMAIPEGVDDPLVRRMFDSAIGEVRGMGEAGRYADMALIGTDDITLGEAIGARRVLRARFSYVLPGGPVYSHIYALAARNFFVKMRITYRQDHATEAIPVLGRALEDLGKIVGPNLQ
jgi:hypothetical protein